MTEELRRSFVNPPTDFRPLQIIHGFDSLGQDADRIGSGLDALAAVGCGGVVANVAWPGYLRDEDRWHTFLLGAEAARRRGLALWLYDEEGYPSGAAGDIVLDGHPELEARGLIGATAEVAPGETARVALPDGAEAWVCAVALLPAEKGIAERVILNVTGSAPIEWRAPDASTPWALYCFASRVMFEGTHATTNVFAKRRYVNLLDPRVGRRFVEVTHKEYARRMSPEALAHVAATFTDEPSLIVAYHDTVESWRPGALPWCSELPREFADRAGYALEARLPELFLDIGDDYESVRVAFYRVVSELIAENFFAPIQEWCRANGIASSGHLLCEERLSWHVWFEGDLFRCLRRMDWPGIDVLSSAPEDLLAGDGFLTPKFVSSAAHICDRPIVMSETSDFVQRMGGGAASLAQMAGTAGLQYALGVNLITSYYPWRSYGPDDAADWLKGAPAPGSNAYRAYCDYVGRLGVMLRGGRHACPVAVYYPVHAMQALFRPSTRPYHQPDAHGAEVAALDALVRDLARGLLHRQLDFDFVDDEALAAADIRDGSLRIADESYRLLILPGARVMERDALTTAVRFAQAGGAVVCVGTLPEKAARWPDADAAAKLGDDLRGAGVEALSLEDALAQAADRVGAEVMLEPQSPQVLVLHRVRDDGLHVYFLTNTSGDALDLTARFATVTAGDAWLYRPRTGAIEPCMPSAADGFALTLDPYEGAFIVSA
ncbi:MAG: hypothetical protein JSV65_02495 [Armatimonadota bacterium]|nr:MAG: hypothetical protein JSV65_02495 [Armatimonadota bacterium]